ncbi:hypothetical protein [Tolypothrix sp. VBCCA 56010]|uniref:hypothetical protein n=1 Tax=Tolypothrix sp. VBCCA 56010 TaxID=3137731 RepID=UPI003D7EBF68
MSDVFDRLKNKARPTVPARDTSLAKKENSETLNDKMTESSHLSNMREQDADHGEVLKDGSTAPRQEQPTDSPQTIRRTIRLEEDTDSKLEAFCNTQKITRDNFIEAAFVVCSQNEKLMQEILKEAKQRYQHRKQLGEQRKFQTMAKKMNLS